MTRPQVQKFAQLMEQRLQENDWKPGWQEDLPSTLMGNCQFETKQLQEVLIAFIHASNAGIATPEMVTQVGLKVADVANWLMFVADVVGAL